MAFRLSPDPGRSAGGEEVDEDDPTITGRGEGTAVGGETDTVDRALVVFEIVQVILEFALFVFIQMEKPELWWGQKGGREERMGERSTFRLQLTKDLLLRMEAELYKAGDSVHTPTAHERHGEE